MPGPLTAAQLQALLDLDAQRYCTAAGADWGMAPKLLIETLGPLCREVLRLREERDRLKQVVADADLLFGAGWRESLQAVRGQPHEAMHAQCAKLAGRITELEAERDSLRAGCQPCPRCSKENCAIQGLHGQIIDANQENYELRQRLTAVEAERDHLRRWQGDFDTVVQQRDRAEKERDQARIDYQTYQDEYRNIAALMNVRGMENQSSLARCVQQLLERLEAELNQFREEFVRRTTP